MRLGIPASMFLGRIFDTRDRVPDIRCNILGQCSSGGDFRRGVTRNILGLVPWRLTSFDSWR